MPKNTGLKLFTKTWPLKRDKKSKEDERRRPLTATLEKPTILDIRFIGKIDMSTVRKEFLNITNLCRIPLIIKQKRNGNRPLSLLSSDMHRKKSKKKKPENSEDSREDDESSVIQSAKIKRIKSKTNGKLSNNNSVIYPVKKNSILAIKNSVISDANNNKTLLKVPSRKPTLATIQQPVTNPLSNDLVKSSTKLPTPCKTCGRPDLPERFHSHPATPLKLTPRKNVVPEEQEAQKNVPVKSIVQKPIAIKYKSKNGSSAKRTSVDQSALPVPLSNKTTTLSTNKNKVPILTNKELNNNKEATLHNKETLHIVKRPAVIEHHSESTMNSKNVALRGGSGKRTLTCYICGREFGTASLSLHEPKCLQKLERENANLPPNLRRKAPVKPDGNISQKEWNQLAWESSQATLVPCSKCGRTFYPDRLVVHQRSCKAPENSKKCSSNDTSYSSMSSMSQSSDPSSSSNPNKAAHQPPSVECYICGRMFGTHSIKIHERNCLKKWHTENESLPPDMRSPAPTKNARSQQSLPPEQTRSTFSSTPSPSAKNSKDDRPASGTKSPLFPCYLCGKLFTVNSIYIHEPQCLKMWKIENDKLPPNKRRPQPLKPDVKFTRSGKVNFQETSNAYWESHLNQLVPCKMCSRTFNPDRVAVHERSCKGN